jgi:hypothetical protein
MGPCTFLIGLQISLHTTECCKNVLVSHSTVTDGLSRIELPYQYPYNPRLGLILLIFGVGLLWIAVLWLPGGRVPTGFSFWFGFVPITLALLLGVRRIFLERYLYLDNDGHGTPNRSVPDEDGANQLHRDPAYPATLPPGDRRSPGGHQNVHRRDCVRVAPR